jgi:hypothetical protein
MKFLFIFLSLLVSSLLFSQAPEGINYQAVMRNSSGNLVTNSTVAIRVQVRQATATGTAVYQERHSVVTSSQGLINLVIGSGTPQTGTFNAINWAVGPFFVNLGVDFSNGANYQDFGTQQLMSVPYALYAKKSGVQLNQWRYGNTVPVNTLGVLGDFYLDVVTGNVYYKNSTTTWVLTGNIKGPVGPSGTTGAQGAQGIQGLNGSQGIQGATGAQGTQGIQGVAGTNGTNGTNGQNTLVKTITEAAGANCTSGGVKIEYGLDANSNGTLDVSEINATLTKYVCNGAQGTAGSQNAWSLTGNVGTNPTNNFLGTTDAQDIVVKTNGSERLRVLSNGNVGIGTNNPLTKLHVRTTTPNNALLLESEFNPLLLRSLADGCYISLFTPGYTNSTSRAGWIGYSTVNASSIGIWNQTPNGRINFGTNNVQRITIDSTGNLGIGTAAPIGKFHVVNDVSGSDSSLVFTNSGKLGIGLSNPSHTLQAQNSLGSLLLSSTTGATFVERAAGVPLKVIMGSNDNSVNYGQIELARGSGIGESAFISCVGDGMNGVGSVGISFQTLGLKFKVQSDGNVGIGVNSPQRSLHVSDVMRLEPRATAPTAPAKGDMYFDSTLNKLRVYDGTAWQNCW